KSGRLFKGIFCNNISEFESYMPSHAVASRHGHSGQADCTPIAARQNPTVAERVESRVASALGRGCVPWAIALVRDRRLGVWRVCRVLLDAADEIERGVQRLVVLWIRRDIGLRAGLLVPFGLEMSAQRRLAARVGARLEFFGDLLQHLDVGRDTLRLDRTSRRREIARGGQPQRAIAGAERNDGLHRTLAERTRADDG